MRCGLSDRHVAEKINGMMDDRFTVFKFFAPIPYDKRKADWPQCAACAATFFLRQHAQPVLPLHCSSLVESLRELARHRETGMLEEEEFRVLKRRMLCL
jgi:hypothetical protein